MNQLELALKRAKEEDQKQYQKDLALYEEDKAEWEQLQAITKGVLNFSPDAYKEAIVYFDPFSEIKDLGSKLEMKLQSETITIDFTVNGPGLVKSKEINTQNLTKID